MRFKCKTCGETVKKEPRVPAGFAGWAYYCSDNDMEWLERGEEMPPLDCKEYWERREIRPEVGEVCAVLVRKPFDEDIGNEFFLQLRSPRDYFSDEMTDEVIALGGIIKCRFESVVSRDEYKAWIKVTVLEVIMNDELYKAFKPYEINGPLVPNYDEEWKYTDKWKNIEIWSGQGDLGEICDIFTDDDGREHIVLQNYWDLHNEYVYFGNIVAKN